MIQKNAARKTAFVCALALLLLVLGAWIASQKSKSTLITLHGASQFDDQHSYTQALVRFSELVEKYYQGPRQVKFVLHKNGELGSEKDFFGYMNIGAVVDYAVVAPSHASTFSSMITIMDVPFLFRDANHYLSAIDANVFKRVEEDVKARADILILGYGGGEKRHLFGRKPIRNMAELKGFDIRVMGSPIQSRIFAAMGASPTVIGSGEVYNAIQTGVIEGAENSAAALSYFKWYEVAPDVSLSAVSFIVRPLFFSGKRFKKLPIDLQNAIIRAGREAMEFERHLEIEIDDPLMAQLEKEGKVTLHTFAERDELLRLSAPVKEEFAKEIGASDILQAINSIQ